MIILITASASRLGWSNIFIRIHNSHDIANWMNTRIDNGIWYVDLLEIKSPSRELRANCAMRNRVLS